MTNRTTDAEKIHALQTSLLMQIAEHDRSAVYRFVAHAAFSAEDPIAALQKMKNDHHRSLPPLAGRQVSEAAGILINLVYA